MLMQLLVGCERCCTTREDLPETMQEFVALCGHDIDLFELLWRKGFLCRTHRGTEKSLTSVSLIESPEPPAM